MKLLASAVLSFVSLAVILAVLHRTPRGAGGATRSEEYSVPAGGPVLVELFTSEGCSSCPPADAVLTKLQEQPFDGIEVITLSEHVDYWNHLGWRDPFSSALFSARQAAYSKLFLGDVIYTPQMVVDGQEQFLGSDMSYARTAIANAARRGKARVTIEQTDDSKQASPYALLVSVRVEQLPASATNKPVDVLLAVAESGLRSSVRRGENSGRSLTHSSVVRKLERIGSLDPGASSTFSAQHRVTIDGSWNRAQLRIVAIAQERASLHVVGVSSAMLSARGK